MYIVVDGIDGAGKTSVTEELKLYIENEGYEVVLWQEPYNPEIQALLKQAKELEEQGFGEYFDRIQNDIFAMLFTVDRYMRLGELRRHLDEGKIVLADRSYISTLVYQERCGLDLLGHLTIFVEEPDLVILLDAEPMIAYSRICGRGKPIDPFERMQTLEENAEKYKEAVALINSPSFIVDANREFDEVFEDCRDVMDSLFTELENIEPLGAPIKFTQKV